MCTMVFRCKIWRRGFFLLVWFVLGMVLFLYSSLLLHSERMSRSPYLYKEMKLRFSGVKQWNNSYGYGLFGKNAHNVSMNISTVPAARTTLPPILQDHYVVMPGTMGRLGNHLFQFATLVGIAERHRYVPVIRKASSLRNIFDITVKSSVGALRNPKGFSEKRAGMFDQRIINLSHDANWTLHGYFQSWRYFGDAAEVLRKQLKFKGSIIEKAKKLLPDNKDKTLRIGVHVRRGDMNSVVEFKRGYNVADAGFLNRSMEYFRKRFQKVVFVVVSDDIKWCKKNIVATDTTIMRTSKEIDLAILSLCDHNIVTTGSFGWWGAWLSGGETVYYKNFPRNNTWLDKQYSKPDYYPPHWIGML